jgi:hypothetical protein
MTGKPTIQVGLLLSMAFNAKPHPEGCAFDSIHTLHNPVTVLAYDVLLDMTLMIEQDVFGQVIRLSPGG